MYFRPTADTRFNILAVGTCRLDGPLRAGAQSYGYQWIGKRIYGYSHAISEVVQQVKFLHGEYTPDPALWNVIAKRDITRVSNEAFARADINLVEISSRKQLSIDDHAVQINHLKSVCAPFFDCDARKSRFWNALRDKDRSTQQTMIDDFAAHVGLTSDQQHLLRRLQLSETTDRELQEGLTYLREALAEPIIMTHVDALKSDGRRISNRSSCVEQVERVAGQIGLTVFNPTGAMHEVGQSRAIEDESESFAHFTELFSSRLFDVWHSELLCDRVDQRMKTTTAESDVRKYEVHMRACLDADGIGPCNDRIEKLTADPAPFDNEIKKLAMRLNAKANNTGRAQAIATQIVLDGEIDRNLFFHATQHALQDANIDLLHHCLHLVCEASMVEDNPWLVSALTDFARLDAHAAVETYLDLFNRHANARSVTLAAICDAVERDAGLVDRAVLRKILRQLNSKDFAPQLMARVTVLAGGNPVTLLFETMGQSTDRFFQAYDVFARSDPEKALLTARAILLILESESCQAGPVIHSFVEAAENEEDLTQRVALLANALSLDPSNVAAKRRMYDLRKSVLADARKAYLASHSAALQDLLGVAARFVPPIDQISYFLGRLRYVEGDFNEALRLGKQAVDLAPEVTDNWSLVLRSAVSLREFEVAEAAAQTVLRVASPEETKAIDEASKRLRWAQEKVLHGVMLSSDSVYALRMLKRVQFCPGLATKAIWAIDQAVRAVASDLEHFIQGGQVDEAWSLMRGIAPVCADDPNCREIVAGALNTACYLDVALSVVENLTKTQIDDPAGRDRMSEFQKFLLKNINNLSK